MSDATGTSYEKCILWPITISDYSRTRGYRFVQGKPQEKSSIFTTKYDRIRITGANNANGFNTLSPPGYVAWDDKIYDNSTKIS